MNVTKVNCEDLSSSIQTLPQSEKVESIKLSRTSIMLSRITGTEDSSTMFQPVAAVGQPCEFWITDLKCDSPKQGQLDNDHVVTPRRKRSPGCRGMAEYMNEMTITDLPRRLQGRSSPARMGSRSLEHSCHSTGTIRERGAPMFPQSTSVLRASLSAGANDLKSWPRNDAGRRRRRRSSLLKAVSSSLRSLPRELEIENDQAKGMSKESETTFLSKQEIVDRRIDSIIGEFAEGYLPMTPML